MDTGTAIAGGTALTQVMPFLHNLLDDATKEVGLTFRDYVEHFRKRNLIKLMVGTEKLAKEAGYDPKPLRPSILIPIVEAASKTDDESLQQMFQRLLGAYIDPTKDEPHPTFIKIAEQLSALDTKGLEALRLNDSKLDIKLQGEGFHLTQVRSFLPGDVQEVSDSMLTTSLNNLERLGVVSSRYIAGGPGERYSPDGFQITGFGTTFALCCLA